MPHWVVMSLLVAVGWLVLSIGGGLIVGRLLALASRRHFTVRALPARRAGGS
jgi:hypothetical protein